MALRLRSTEARWAFLFAGERNIGASAVPKTKPAITKDENLPPPELWTLKAGGVVMNCSLPTVYQRIAEGDIKAFKVGYRTMLDPESVRAFMRSRPIKPAKRKRPAKPAADDKRASAGGTP